MKSSTVKPQSVYLTADELEQVRKIAAALEISEHAVRKFAIQRLLKDWGRGWRPKRGRKVVKTLVP